MTTTYEVTVEVKEDRAIVSLVDTERKLVAVDSGETIGEAFENTLTLIEREK